MVDNDEDTAAYDHFLHKSRIQGDINSTNRSRIGDTGISPSYKYVESEA